MLSLILNTGAGLMRRLKNICETKSDYMHPAFFSNKNLAMPGIRETIKH